MMMPKTRNVNHCLARDYNTYTMWYKETYTQNMY